MKTTTTALIFTVILLLTCFSISGFAQNAAEPVAKKRIAVLGITNNNVSTSYAKIARNTIEYILFSTDEFNLLERQHIDKVLKERNLLKGVQQGTKTGTGNAIRIGKSLATDFIILGSIDRLEDYKISIRVVSVRLGKIVSAYSKNFKHASSIDVVTGKLAKQVARDIKQFILTGKIEARFFDFHSILLGADLNFCYPVGTFGDMVNPGFGADISLGVDNLFFENSVLSANIGYYAFEGSINSNDSAVLVPISLGLGWRFYALPRVFFFPYVQSGVNISTLKHGSGDGFDMDDNTTSYGISPVVQGGLSVGFAVHETVIVEFGTRFSVILESGDPMMYMGIALGMRGVF